MTTPRAVSGFHAKPAIRTQRKSSCASRPPGTLQLDVCKCSRSRARLSHMRTAKLPFGRPMFRSTMMGVPLRSSTKSRPHWLCRPHDLCTSLAASVQAWARSAGSCDGQRLPRFTAPPSRRSWSAGAPHGLSPIMYKVGERRSPKVSSDSTSSSRMAVHSSRSGKLKPSKCSSRTSRRMPSPPEAQEGFNTKRVPCGVSWRRVCRAAFSSAEEEAM
mmetsp:Transcript_102374/g.315895  ORF Transcript_102374/g.315895 Transcript_102374/m.315895 type:complete len:216 (-) Transcript_102374:495-1142(-)